MFSEIEEGKKDELIKYRVCWILLDVFVIELLKVHLQLDHVTPSGKI